jgi:hypothetical protein
MIFLSKFDQPLHGLTLKKKIKLQQQVHHRIKVSGSIGAPALKSSRCTCSAAQGKEVQMQVKDYNIATVSSNNINYSEHRTFCHSWMLI